VFDGLYHDWESGEKYNPDEQKVDGVNNWYAKPDLKTLKQNPYDGLYYDLEGKKWFHDEDLEVAGVNNWSQKGH
jgi:hypothetical protein